MRTGAGSDQATDLSVLSTQERRVLALIAGRDGAEVHFRASKVVLNGVLGAPVVILLQHA